MVENTHCDLEGLVRTRRVDPIERTGASVNVKITVGAVAGEKLGLEFDEVCH